MKKILIVMALVLLSIPVFAKMNCEDVCDKITQLEQKETMQKVGEHLYFDVDSVENDGNGYIQGTFKQYNIKQSGDKKHDKYKRKIYAYSLISVGIYCDSESDIESKKMDYPIYKYYDFKGKLRGEDNIRRDWNNEFPGGHLGITFAEHLDNGDIYYDTLKKYSKTQGQMH